MCWQQWLPSSSVWLFFKSPPYPPEFHLKITWWRHSMDYHPNWSGFCCCSFSFGVPMDVGFHMDHTQISLSPIKEISCPYLYKTATIHQGWGDTWILPAQGFMSAHMVKEKEDQEGSTGTARLIWGQRQKLDFSGLFSFFLFPQVSQFSYIFLELHFSVHSKNCPWQQWRQAEEISNITVTICAVTGRHPVCDRSRAATQVHGEGWVNFGHP